jgi:hypothetical protein
MTGNVGFLDRNYFPDSIKFLVSIKKILGKEKKYFVFHFCINFLLKRTLPYLGNHLKDYYQYTANTQEYISDTCYCFMFIMSANIYSIYYIKYESSIYIRPNSSNVF